MRANKLMLDVGVQTEGGRWGGGVGGGRAGPRDADAETSERTPANGSTLWAEGRRSGRRERGRGSERSRTINTVMEGDGGGVGGCQRLELKQVAAAWRGGLNDGCSTVSARLQSPRLMSRKTTASRVPSINHPSPPTTTTTPLCSHEYHKMVDLRLKSHLFPQYNSSISFLLNFFFFMAKIAFVSTIQVH